jgi:hypothetical protein
MDIGYLLDPSGADSSRANQESAVLSPYPNPAVVSEMGGRDLTFRFQVATDENGLPIYGEAYSGLPPYLVVDIYTVAGERVRTIADPMPSSDYNMYEIGWDMKNDNGEEVASGAYIAYARLYVSESDRTLLAEEHTKVAIIR